MPVIRLCWMLLLAVAIAGCASTPDYEPIEPDMSLLAPAQQALTQARAAHVKKFAPRALDAARQKMSLARDVIYLAASKGRGLNPAEHERVVDLVQSARLDAKLALVKTQARATRVKLEQLQRAVAKQAGSKRQSTAKGAF